MRFAFLSLLLLIPFAFALPENSIKLSYAVALIGGILMAFAPCSYALIPAYFAVTFKERKNLVRSTLIFFLGFVSTFMFIGLTASLIGRILNIYSTELIKISGILFILFGVMVLFGKGFSFKQNYKPGKSTVQILLFGMLFSIGFAACTGPVFYAILTLAANLPTYSAVIFTFFYSLGLFVPLFIMSFFFDKINFSKLNWLNKQVFSIKNTDVKVWNLVASILFVGIGLIYLIYGNSSAIEYPFAKLFLDKPDNIYNFIYSIQDYFLANGLSDIWLLLIGLIIIGYLMWKYRSKIKELVN